MAFRCRVDAALGFEYVDEGSKRVTGYNEVELVETRQIALPDLVHPAGREEVRRLIQDGITRRGTFAIPFEILTKDRIPAEGILIGKGIFTSPLNLTAIEGYLLRMETLNRDPDAHAGLFPEMVWQRMLDHTSEIVAYLKGDGIVRYITQSVMRILGYQTEQVIGSVFSHLIHPDERSRFEDIRQRIHVKGSSGSSARFIGMHAGGDQIHIIIHLYASGDPDGSVVLTVSNALEEESFPAKADNLLSTICAASPVPLIITSTEDRRILLVNDSFVHLIGRREAEEVSGLSLTDAGLEISPDEIITIDVVLEQTGVYEGHETEIHTDTRDISVFLSARRFKATGQQVVTWSVVPLPAGRSDR